MLMRGDVDFAISGPFERLAVNGTIGLTGGYYTRNIDFLSKIGSSAPPAAEGGGSLFSFTDPPLKDAVFDIRVTSIEPFMIRTNLVRGFLRPELSLRGTGELPFLVGRVYIDPSRVLLPSGRLTIQSGVLHFLAANPDRPELDLMAQSRVLDYDINVITRGPLDDLAITLSSSPPLPNEDLMLLLLTGQPPRDDVAAGTQSTASTNVMLYLGRDFLTRWLGDDSGASDESIFDRFEMNFGRNVTKSGDQTVESSFRLSEDITGTGKKYYLTGEKDRYDHYNYGLRLVFRLE
jgi:translocation and assembly module TamB